jgi:hypothetical protein
MDDGESGDVGASTQRKAEVLWHLSNKAMSAIFTPKAQ